MGVTNKPKKIVRDFAMKLTQITFVVIIFSMAYHDNFLVVAQKGNNGVNASNSFLSNRTDDESSLRWLGIDNDGNFRIEGTLKPDTVQPVSRGEQLTLNQNMSSDSDSSTSLPEGLLGGSWKIDVVNGNVEYFASNVTMVTSAGTEMHDHLIEFKSNNPNVMLLPNNTAVTNPDSSMTEIAALNFSKSDDENITRLSRSDNTIGFSGAADIQTNGVIEWRQIPIAVTIINRSEINIEIDPKTVNSHFSEMPIYGSVNSVEPLVVIQNGTS
jgi:hypothetical protein